MRTSAPWSSQLPFTTLDHKKCQYCNELLTFWVFQCSTLAGPIVTARLLHKLIPRIISLNSSDHSLSHFLFFPCCAWITSCLTSSCPAKSKFSRPFLQVYQVVQVIRWIGTSGDTNSSGGDVSSSSSSNSSSSCWEPQQERDTHLPQQSNRTEPPGTSLTDSAARGHPDPGDAGVGDIHSKIKRTMWVPGFTTDAVIWGHDEVLKASSV